MVDPKKDYELLMRYLQSGGLKRESAAVQEKTYSDDWQPAPAVSPLPVYTSKTPHVLPRLTIGKTIPFPWDKLKKASFYTRVRIATAVIACVILLFILWQGYAFLQLTPESIFRKTYLPFTVAKPAEAIGNSIEYYYASGNYTAVTLKSKKLVQPSDREKFLTGLAYLQRDDYTAAIKWLEPASNNFKSPYRQQAEYYLALTYLKNEDYDRSIEKMEHIASTPSHPFQNQFSENTIRDIKMLKWK